MTRRLAPATLLVLLALLARGPAAAQEDDDPELPPPIPLDGDPEVVLEDTDGVPLEWRRGPKVALAPDGRTVAFLRPDEDGVLHPRVVRPGEPARRVARGNLSWGDPWGGVLAFTADSDHLLTVRGVDSNDDGEVDPRSGDRTRLVLVEVATGETVRTSPEDRTALFPTLAGHRLVYLEVVSFRPLEGVRLVRIDLPEGDRTILGEPRERLPIFGVLGPEGARLACWQRTRMGPVPGGPTLGILDAETGEETRSLEVPGTSSLRVDFPLCWTGNGEHVYYTVGNGSVRRCELASGRTEEIDVDAFPVAPVGDRFVVVNHGTSEGPSVAVHEAGGPGMVEVLPDARALDATPAGVVLFEREGSLHLASLDLPAPADDGADEETDEEPEEDGS